MDSITVFEVFSLNSCAPEESTPAVHACGCIRVIGRECACVNEQACTGFDGSDSGPLEVDPGRERGRFFYVGGMCGCVYMGGARLCE